MCCEKFLHFYFCFGTILIVICHILLDLSIYGSNSQISLPDAIRFVWKTFCTHRKVDRGWQIYFDYYGIALCHAAAGAGSEGAKTKSRDKINWELRNCLCRGIFLRFKIQRRFNYFFPFLPSYC